MLPVKRSRSKTDRLCGVALTCLCVSLLLIVFPVPESPSIASETTATSEGPIVISPGSSINREVTAGVKEEFGITVSQGQLLRFSIDKGDLGLSTVLYGPAGTKLLEHVSHAFEVVEISFPADVAGRYRIEIRSREQADTRRYELKVDPLTAVTTRGRKDSEARQAMSSAEVFRVNWIEASLLQAIAKYDKAALTWTSVGDFSNASRATLRSGDVFFLLSKYPEALKRYQNAEALAGKKGDWLAEARARSHMGLLYSYLGNNDLAQTHLTKALDRLDEVDQTPLVRNAYGEALSNLAEVSYAKGNLAKSRTLFARAGEVFHDDRTGKAKVHLFSGYIAGSIGQPEKAMSEISQALNLYRETNNRSGEGLVLTVLGVFHSFKKDENHAIDLHRKAIEIFHSIGDRHSEAMALNALGQAYEDLDQSVALNNYENALRIFQNIGALDLASVTTFKVAKIHSAMGNPNQAIAYYERGLKMSRAAGKVRTEANGLTEIALIYDSQGRHEQTLKQYRGIQKFYESIDDRLGQAMMLNNEGDLLLRLGQKRQALDVYERVLPLSEKIGDKGILISTLYNLARAHRDLEAHDVALSFIRQSLKVIEDLRTNVGSPDLRASYFSGVRKHYVLCIDILMQLEQLRPGQGFAAQALVVSEQGRARSLLDLLSESNADLRQGAPPELINRERELKGLLRSMAQYQLDLSLNSKDSAEVAEAANQMVQLRAEYQEIQAQLREQNPHLLSLARSTPMSLEQIQRELRDHDTMLLEYALGEERSYLWAVTATSLHSYQLQAGQVIEDAAGEVYKLITARQVFDGKNEGDFQANIEASDKLFF